MPIKKITISNFKSFKELKVELGNFNVLIGANASGKSNFIQVLKFLRDITNYGLDNAISMQGGAKYLRNISIGSSENFSLEAVFGLEFTWPIPRKPETSEKLEKLPEEIRLPNLTKGKIRYDADKQLLIFKGIMKERERDKLLKLSSEVSYQDAVKTLFQSSQLIGIKAYEGIYKFAIKFNKKGSGFTIVEDRLTHKCKFVRLEKQKKGIEEKAELGLGQIVLSKVSRKIKLDPSTQVPIKKEELTTSPYIRFLTEEVKLPPKTLLLEAPFFFTLSFEESVFSSISIYDFDPKLPKKAVAITGRVELEEDGNNLALVLKNVKGVKDKRRKFSNLTKDLLPFIVDLDVENFADKSLLFKVKENYSKDQYLPASLMSDGTINITALIIALYFEKKKLTIIEEPERNIHPHLISKVMDMIKEASKDKQVVVTTHNPEVVRYAGLENILLVSRDKMGFSIISRPSDKEEVRTFLKNDIGIEELYVQNLLGV